MGSPQCPHSIKALNLRRRRQALQASAEIDRTRRDRNSYPYRAAQSCRRLQQTDNLAAKGQLDTCSDTQDRTANPNLDRRVAGTGRLSATTGTKPMRGCRRQQPAAERKLRPPGIKLVCDEARLASRLCPLLPSVPGSPRQSPAFPPSFSAAVAVSRSKSSRGKLGFALRLR